MPPSRNDGGGKASVVVTMVPRDGCAYAAASSLRLIREPSLQARPPSLAACPSTDGQRKKSSANGGFAIKSPSKSAHSSVSGKTSAQVWCPRTEPVLLRAPPTFCDIYGIYRRVSAYVDRPPPSPPPLTHNRYVSSTVRLLSAGDSVEILMTTITILYYILSVSILERPGR